MMLVNIIIIIILIFLLYYHRNKIFSEKFTSSVNDIKTYIKTKLAENSNNTFIPDNFIMPYYIDISEPATTNNIPRGWALCDGKKYKLDNKNSSNINVQGYSSDTNFFEVLGNSLTQNKPAFNNINNNTSTTVDLFEKIIQDRNKDYLEFLTFHGK